MSERPQDRVAAARRLAGRQTQQELADRLTEVTSEQWTRNMVASLEGGRRTFDIATLIAIAEVHGRDPVWYLDGVEVAKTTRAKGLYRDSFLSMASQPMPLLVAA